MAWTVSKIVSAAVRGDRIPRYRFKTVVFTLLWVRRKKGVTQEEASEVNEWDFWDRALLESFIEGSRSGGASHMLLAQLKRVHTRMLILEGSVPSFVGGYRCMDPQLESKSGDEDVEVDWSLNTVNVAFTLVWRIEGRLHEAVCIHEAITSPIVMKKLADACRKKHTDELAKAAELLAILEDTL